MKSKGCFSIIQHFSTPCLSFNCSFWEKMSKRPGSRWDVKMKGWRRCNLSWGRGVNGESCSFLVKSIINHKRHLTVPRKGIQLGRLWRAISSDHGIIKLMLLKNPPLSKHQRKAHSCWPDFAAVYLICFYFTKERDDMWLCSCFTYTLTFTLALALKTNTDVSLWCLLHNHTSQRKHWKHAVFLHIKNVCPVITHNHVQ